MAKTIKTNVMHQGIGGKEFIVDEKITETLSNDEVITKAFTGNWACYNFVMRRPDFNTFFQYKLYYGKVDGLGYVVAEDDFDD